MMRTRVALLLAAVFILWMAGPASAQVTGTITGIVFDQNGAPVGGAVVKVTGDALPAGRTATTPATGQYAFPLLQPGVYTISVTKEGVGDSTRQTIVEVDKTSTVDVVLGLKVQETVDVTAAQPVIDLKSTEVDTNFKRPTMEALPLERSYAGMFQLIPSVADNRSSIGPSAGGSKQDNTYLLDGVNITNPSFGYLSSEVNELDIQEVNIKRAGVSAEFGRAAGVVTNAVTKSGTNSISGTGRIDWLPDSFIGAFTSTAFRDALVVPTVSPALGMGGPLIKDKIFWYGSARYMRSVLGSGRTNKLGASLPDSDSTGHEIYGKLTASLGTRQMFNLAYRDRPFTASNAGLGSGTSASVGFNNEGGSHVATASWAYFPANRTTFEVKYLYLYEKNESVPLNSLGYLPTWNPTNIASMGSYTDPTQSNLTVGGGDYTNTDNYRRHQVRGTFTQFFDIGKSTHQLKGGAGYEFGEENLDRLTNGWGDISVYATYIRARYYFTQPAQLGQARNWSAFAQDNITIGERLTVNAGVLFDQDAYGQNLPGSGGCPASYASLAGGYAIYQSSGDLCTFLKFPFSSEVQPRVGVNYIVDKKVGDKIYFNYGRYFTEDQQSSDRSLAPRRIYQQEVRFNFAGQMIYNAPRASTTGKLIDPSIQPTYDDEFLGGYARPIGKDWSVDAYFMYRNFHNFIEDMPSSPTIYPTTGSYEAANLPCTDVAACEGAVAKRLYKAFTIELTRRLTNKWSANIAYTWSSFVGNFDLDYGGDAAIFNTSSYIQDGPGCFVQDPNRYGPLMQDRPHVFKVFSTWVPTSKLTLGGYFRVQSGTPWAARGQDTQGGSALNYLEPAGSHWNPTWANLDLLASYKVPLGKRFNATIEGRILNLAGNQTQLSTDYVEYLSLANVTTLIIPMSANYNPNPFFGTANGYAPPRRLLVDAKLTF